MLGWAGGGGKLNGMACSGDAAEPGDARRALPADHARLRESWHSTMAILSSKQGGRPRDIHPKPYIKNVYDTPGGKLGTGHAT